VGSNSRSSDIGVEHIFLPLAMTVPLLNNATIVVGSPATAQDGQYQQAILDLAARAPERQMFDRLLDGGTALPSLCL
jgi:hypothetical protein